MSAEAPKQSAHERKMSEHISGKLKRVPTAAEDDEDDDEGEDAGDDAQDSKQQQTQAGAAKDPAKEKESLGTAQRSLRISVHVKDQKPDDENDDFKE